MEKKDYGAHILAVPFQYPGHINPILQFCKRLVSKGFKVTLALAKFRAKSIQSRLGSIQVEIISDGYDDGGFFSDGVRTSLERFKVVGSQDIGELIKKYEVLGQPFDCVVFDSFLPWVLDVAKQFGIPSVSFFTQQCAVNFINYNVYHKKISYPFRSPPISVPGLPPLEVEDMPGYIYVDPEYYELVLSQISNMDQADYVVVNTFYELDTKSVDEMSKVSPLKTIGPTIPSFYLDNRVEDDINYGLTVYQFDPMALNWLNTKPPKSVVYVSFGSVDTASPGDKQMEELAWGLKNSNCYFLWVVKANEEPNLPQNFIQETAGEGLVVRWSPQLEVLAHEATGCFFTHCGWNSTIEALSLGVPMVAFPKWADQPTNAKYIQDVWKTGIRVKGDENRHVGREEIERCIREVMEGERATEMKENAVKWSKLAKQAISEGGSSDKNIDEFVSSLLSRK